MVTALLEENVLSDKLSSVASDLGYASNFFCPAEMQKKGETAWMKVWNNIIGKEQIPELLLIYTSETILKSRELEQYKLPDEYAVDTMTCRIELLQEFITGNNIKRKNIIEKYHFCDDEISCLLNQPRETIIGLHALYCYKYYQKNADKIGQDITVYFTECIKSCLPQHAHNIKNSNIAQIVELMYYYLCMELFIIAFHEENVSKVDLSIDETFSLLNPELMSKLSKKYKTLHFLNCDTEVQELKNIIPTNTCLTLKNSEHVICKFRIHNGILVLTTCHPGKETEPLSTNYVIYKIGDIICFISTSDHTEYYYRNITVKNNQVKLQYIYPIKEFEGTKAFLHELKPLDNLCMNTELYKELDSKEIQDDELDIIDTLTKKSKIDNLPFETLLGNKEKPDTVYCFLELSCFVFLLTFQVQENKLLIKEYLILKTSAYYRLLNESEEYTYKINTCKNDTVLLEAIDPIPELIDAKQEPITELNPINKKETDKKLLTLIEEWENHVESIKKLRIMKYYNRSDKLIIYLYDTEKNTTYKYEKVWENNRPSVIDYMTEDETISLSYTNEIKLKWPQSRYLMPLSEFTLVENEKSTLNIILDNDSVYLDIVTEGCVKNKLKRYKAWKQDFMVLHSIEPDDRAIIKERDGDIYICWPQKYIEIPLNKWELIGEQEY